MKVPNRQSGHEPARPPARSDASTTRRRPAVALAVGAGVLVVLALPAAGMRTSLPGIADLPRSIPAMQSYDRLTAAFPGEGAVHVVAVRAPAERTAEVR